MLADRVKETSTTTGTGNLTLAGAVTDFNTFTSQFEIDDAFIAWIVSDSGQWEVSICHLSASTTLVRDDILSNSSGTTSAISFTGNLTISNNSPAVGLPLPIIGCQSASGAGGLPYINNGLRGRSGSGTFNPTDNVLYYLPFLLNFGMVCDAMAVNQVTAGTGDMYLALYNRKADGYPGRALAKSGTIDITTTGLKVFAFSGPIQLQAGLYYVSLWTPNGSGTVNSFEGQFTLPGCMGLNSNASNIDPFNVYQVTDGAFTGHADQAPASMTANIGQTGMDIVLRSVL